MRKTRIALCTLAVMVGMFLAASGKAAHAFDLEIPEVVVMNLGDPDQTREFYIDNTFDLLGHFGPAKTFIFIGIGDNSTEAPATKLGKLTLTLATTAKRDYSAELDFSLQGIAYGVGDKSSLISAKATAPAKAAKVVTFNTLYGVAFVAATITEIKSSVENGQVELPAPFTLVFSLVKK
ncbi:MAG: hypothetical protein WCQ99_04755 [Pseudomonadota bacterium]